MSHLKKAVLGQAKKGSVESLTSGETSRLAGQVAKLRERTKHFVIFETPLARGGTVGVLRSMPAIPLRLHAPQTLEDYLEQLVRCSHGDKRQSFVEAVQDASLPELSVSFRR